MLTLLITDGEGTVSAVALDKPEVSLGRAEGNTVRLADADVSRVHACVRETDGQRLLVDLASYNGVWCNGRRITEPVPLAVGDRVRLGEVRIEVVEPAYAARAVERANPKPAGEGTAGRTLAARGSNPPGGRTSPAPGAGSSFADEGGFDDDFGGGNEWTAARPRDGRGGELPAFRVTASDEVLRALTDAAAVPYAVRQLRLVFASPPGVHPPVTLDKLPITLGAGAAADVVLAAEGVAALHARVFAEEGDAWIEALDEAGVLTVDGAPTRRSALAPNAMVTLGGVTLRLSQKGYLTGAPRAYISSRPPPALHSAPPPPMHPADVHRGPTRLLSAALGVVLGLSALAGMVLVFQAMRPARHGRHHHAQAATASAYDASAAEPDDVAVVAVAETDAGAPTGARSVVPIPLGERETIAQRIQRATEEANQLEVERVLSLLLPLHERADVPPPLAIEAAFMEIDADLVLERAADAERACRRLVALAGRDGGVFRGRSPRVQQLCLRVAGLPAGDDGGAAGGRHGRSDAGAHHTHADAAVHAAPRAASDE